VSHRAWAVAAAVALAAAAAVGGALVLSGAPAATAMAGDVPVSTAPVQRGDLAATVSQSGTLTYRARPDGSPYTVVNQARGVYTELPETGDRIACGEVLYRVDERPVLLLCGSVPAYRDLYVGRRGKDVRQLNHDLHKLGDAFTTRTRKSLERLQRRVGAHASGRLDLGAAVFLPSAARVAKVSAQLGAVARPGALVVDATSDELRVQLALDPAEQGSVKQGDKAQITLPGTTAVAGTVEAFGRLAPSAAKDGAPADATIPTSIRLDDPSQARGLESAPVQVDITTTGVEDVLSVPVTALVGRAGGGFAVEVVRAGGRRELVAVRLGLFDTAGGRVEVDGALRAGERVVVPSP
jgi:hypothetical protein